MNLRRKTLSLVVAALASASIQPAHAGGCGGFGGLSVRVGGGGLAGRVMGNHGGMLRSHSSHPQPVRSHNVPSHAYPQNPPHFQPTHSYPQPMPQQHVQVQPQYPQEFDYVDRGFEGGSDWGMPSSQQVMQQQVMQQQVMQQQGVQQQGVQQQVMQSPAPLRQASRPAPQAVVAPSTNARPVSNVASQPILPESNVNSSLSSNAPADASEMSALQMLASLNGDDGNSGEPIAQPLQSAAADVPEFTAVASQASSAHVGSWTVTLPGNQTISLILDHENRFQWLATKDGKSTRFDGQFRLEGSRLTLVRSSDLQQMAGDWTGEGDNFTFKLDGATNSGLVFVRGQ